MGAAAKLAFAVFLISCSSGRCMEPGAAGLLLLLPLPPLLAAAVVVGRGCCWVGELQWNLGRFSPTRSPSAATPQV